MWLIVHCGRRPMLAECLLSSNHRSSVDTEGFDLWIAERNANFWHGAIAMTALGMLVNEIKDFQYGNERKRTWAQTLTDGIDRAGLLAVFSDMNHALETITSNRIGIDAMAGGSVRPTSPRQMMGMFGPGASILYDFGNMASETFQGEAFKTVLWAA